MDPLWIEPLNEAFNFLHDLVSQLVCFLTEINDISRFVKEPYTSAYEDLWDMESASLNMKNHLKKAEESMSEAKKTPLGKSSRAIAELSKQYKKTDKPTEIYQGIGSDTEDTEYDPFDDETLLAPQTLTAEEEYEFIDPGFVSDLEEKSHLGNEDVTLGAATSADDPRGLPLILGASASLPESINMMTNVAVGMMPHIPGDEAYESRMRVKMQADF